MARIKKVEYRGYKQGRLVFVLNRIPSKQNYNYDSVYKEVSLLGNGMPPKYIRRKVR